MALDRLQQRKIETRVDRAAEAALERGHALSAVDVLGGMGWLPWGSVDRWRQGRVTFLESELQVGASKVDAAVARLRQFAADRGMDATETDYVARTPDRRPLRFTADGDPARDALYRTTWIAPDLSPKEHDRVVERERKAPELVVIEARKPWTCVKCGTTERSLLIMIDDGPHCMDCGDLGGTVYLTRGDALLTRRARKYTDRFAVVVRFSTTRKRYERQGILVDEAAAEQAEAEVTAERARKG